MTARHALVTGAGGFAGQWLCRELARQGWQVTGASLDGDPGVGVLSEDDHALIAWQAADVSDRAVVARLLDAADPHAIFHLAGMAYVPDAALDPRLALDVNVGAALTLLGEVRTRRRAGTLDPVLLLVGSAEQYGRHDHDAMPLSEEAECRPRNLYAATKLAQEVFGLEAFREDGTQVVCTRSFNHAGRGQRDTFLLPSLVRRVLEAGRTGAPTIAIGNTGTVRDFLHVEDAVRAYVRLADDGFAGEVYNVCSGEGVSVEALAREVMLAAGVDAALAPDDTLRRAVDVPILVGRNDKLRADTGWVPQRHRADIIQELIHAAS